MRMAEGREKWLQQDWVSIVEITEVELWKPYSQAGELLPLGFASRADSLTDGIATDAAQYTAIVSAVLSVGRSMDTTRIVQN